MDVEDALSTRYVGTLKREEEDKKWRIQKRKDEELKKALVSF